MIRPTDILREYGEAIRGRWTGLDGRCVRGDLNELAEIIEDTDNGDLSAYGGPEVIRQDLGICQYGHGHWSDECDESCAKEES